MQSNAIEPDSPAINSTFVKFMMFRYVLIQLFGHFSVCSL